MLPNILSFQSFLYFAYDSRWVPSFLFCLLLLLLLNSVFLNKCNNNQQQVLRFIFGGDLWDFGLLYFMFCDYFAEKSGLYRGHETGKWKQTKDAANIRVVTNFLSFVCLSQSDSRKTSKNPIRLNKNEKNTNQKIAAGFFQLIQFLCKSISIYQQKKCLFVTGKRV